MLRDLIVRESNLPLMRLVHDDAAVIFEVRVVEAFPEQNPVGHVFDDRLLARDVLEPDRVPDFPAQGHLHLLGNSLGHTDGGDPTRLRAADHAVGRVAFLVEVLSELGGLPGACLAHDYCHAVVLDDLHQLLANLEDRQKLALFFDRFVLCEVAHGFVFYLQGHSELVCLLVIHVALIVDDCVVDIFFFFLNFEDIS